jgi:rubrerythrin
MTLRTQRNLDVAMHGEAFGAAKYKRFAAFARSNGDKTLADLLTDVADESRIGHFAKELQLAGVISDDLTNLQDMVRDKLYHIERYTQFAKEAEQDGDTNAAALFESLANDDKQYISRIERALSERKP